MSESILNVLKGTMTDTHTGQEYIVHVWVEDGLLHINFPDYWNIEDGEMVLDVFDNLIQCNFDGHPGISLTVVDEAASNDNRQWSNDE
jgi:hypothetical protein